MSDVFDIIRTGPKVARAVGNLRGTRAAMQRSYKRTTQSEIAMLRRAINRNAAELQTFRSQAQSYNRALLNAPEVVIDISLSELLISDPNFRENVLGDKYRNKYLALNFATSCDKVRVILYKPKDPGQSISTAAMGNPMVDFLEPNAWNILHDRVINVPSTSKHPYFQFSLSKRLNFLTTINSDANDVVKSGDIRLMVITNGAVGDQVVLSTMMKYQNK